MQTESSRHSSAGGHRLHRGLAVAICLASASSCIAYAAFRDDLPGWWRQYGGGVPYVVFWITFAFVFAPSRWAIARIAWGATAITCLVEFSQLYRVQWLDDFRSTTLGAALLGSTFGWSDMPPYLIGGVVGYVALWLLFRFASKTSGSSPSNESMKESP